jgi:hypothetical protein
MNDAQPNTTEDIRPEPLAETFALSERLIQATRPERTRPTVAELAERLKSAVGYWVWRLTGRRLRAQPAVSPKLLATLHHYDKDLEKAYERIRALEARLAERDRSAELVAAADLRTQEQRLRADEAEQALSQAYSRIEILKDALEVTKATKAGNTPADHRFREAKRAFARMYHPDTGGDPTRQQLFAEFWPVLERIEREL